MRNYLKTFSVTLALLLSLAGCKKDDEKSDSIRVGDEKFKVESGVLTSFGFAPGVEGLYYALTLVSPGVNVDEFGNLTGSGKIIRFYVVSTSFIGLATGEYEFHDGPSPYNTFRNASHNLTWEYGVYHPYTDIVSGVLTVKNNNGIYEISIDCGDENGDDVTGYFKGSLLCVDGMLITK